MKNFVIFIFIALTLNASSQQITKAEIIATGLTCSMCSNAIYKQLKATDGVDSVKTDLNKNMFIVFLSETRNVSPVVLKEKIEKAGFFVG
ncbi:MAG: heavy-metal-associated domain-containing protein, partial [Chitinophagaceae bacterium]